MYKRGLAFTYSNLPNLELLNDECRKNDEARMTNRWRKSLLAEDWPLDR